jgi:soluble lytic murein transglycosylase-like protein
MGKKSKVKKVLLRLILLALVIVIAFYNPVSVRLMTLGTAIYYNLDPIRFYRLISTESSFRSFAVSHQQAIGLGQVKEGTAGYVNTEHKRGWLFFPLYNLKISALYVKYLLNRYNHNWSLALAAYNWGETNVDKRIKGMDIQTKKDYADLFYDIPETRIFISRILK